MLSVGSYSGLPFATVLCGAQTAMVEVPALLDKRLGTTRELERFRNHLAIASAVQHKYGRVRDIYEDRYACCLLSPFPEPCHMHTSYCCSVSTSLSVCLYMLLLGLGAFPLSGVVSLTSSHECGVCTTDT